MIDIHRYNSLNEKLRLAIYWDCKTEIKEYKAEMEALLRGK